MFARRNSSTEKPCVPAGVGAAPVVTLSFGARPW